MVLQMIFCDVALEPARAAVILYGWREQHALSPATV
jgi:hypothetical protein